MIRFHRLALITTVMTWLLVVVGGTVRVTGSGLGCPDWPLCHGRLIPPLDDLATVIEYSHRLVASVGSALIVLTAIVGWFAHRRDRWIAIPSIALLPMLLVQILLGGVTVLLELPPTVVAVHLGVASLLLALLAIATTASACAGRGLGPVHVNGTRRQDGFATLTGAAAVGVFLAIVSGAYTLGSNASLGCLEWPLCRGGQWLPLDSPAALIHMLHRYVVLAAGVLIAATVVQAWRTRRGQSAVLTLTTLSGIVFAVQVLVGAGQVWLLLAGSLRILHLGLAAAVWAGLVAVWALGRLEAQSQPADSGSPPPSSEDRRRTRALSTYLNLMKLRIVALLLLTTLAAMIVAGNGAPSVPLVLFTLLGGGLAAGGASAFNQYLDRGIDNLMTRTNHRPVAAGLVEPREALWFAIAASAAGLAVLALFVNSLTAGLAALGGIHYVFVYSWLLKRVTPQNIVVGGAAGGIAPLVGWAAATGGLDLTAAYLFAVIFFWTPPHFWALALLIKGEYERARIPMLPVVVGDQETKRQILLYSLELVAVTLLLVPLRAMGLLYLGLAVLLGGVFVALAWKLARGETRREARRLFRYSILYLALLFGVMVLDRTTSAL